MSRSSRIPDPALDRAHDALEGLSVGDAFGERFFVKDEVLLERIRARTLPPPPWRWTDDTQMALSIVDVLDEEGIAGGVAVAIAAALAWRSRGAHLDAAAFLAEIAAHTPAGYTADGMKEAAAMPRSVGVVAAAVALGNGSGVTAPDTVPFALWCAAHHADDYADAMWTTVAGLGDRDTTCAIAGGVVAARLGKDAIPAAWRAAREPLA